MLETKLISGHSISLTFIVTCTCSGYLCYLKIMISYSHRCHHHHHSYCLIFSSSCLQMGYMKFTHLILKYYKFGVVWQITGLMLQYLVKCLNLTCEFQFIQPQNPNMKHMVRCIILSHSLLYTSNPHCTSRKYYFLSFISFLLKTVWLYQKYNFLSDFTTVILEHHSKYVKLTWKLEICLCL
jgi:hypothetical protein